MPIKGEAGPGWHCHVRKTQNREHVTSDKNCRVARTENEAIVAFYSGGDSAAERGESRIFCPLRSIKSNTAEAAEAVPF